MWSAMLALVQGRLVEAEGLRAQALEVGRRGGDKVAELFAWIQEFYVKWERGAEDLGAPPDTVAVQPVQSALRSDLPLLLAEAERTDEARAELKALAREDFAAVPRDLNWLASLAGLSQAVAVLGDVARARPLYAMLAPYASRAILIGRAAVCLGPVELYLGLLAGTIAEFVAAERHFGAAKAWCKTTGATLWAVWADVHRARMLLHASSSAGETAAAAHLATQGLSVAERHDLGRAASHARDLARAAQAQA